VASQDGSWAPAFKAALAIQTIRATAETHFRITPVGLSVGVVIVILVFIGIFLYFDFLFFHLPVQAGVEIFRWPTARFTQ
jgi:hypothetical protein